jgi:hypothetical protein
MMSNFYGEGNFENPRMGKLNLYQKIATMKKNETDGTTYRDFDNKQIPYSKCVLGKNFIYPDVDEIKDFHIEDFYCPDTDKIII